MSNPTTTTTTSSATAAVTNVNSSTVITSSGWKQSSSAAYAIFPKLTSLNYFCWEQDRHTTLTALNQLCIVEGSVTGLTAPADTAPATEIAEYEMKHTDWMLCRASAFAEIALHCKDEQRDQLMDSDLVQAWKTLRDLYGGGIVGICHVLLATKYDGQEGILLHKAKLVTLRKQLVDAGEVLSNQHFLSVFIASLPKLFDTLVTSIQPTETLDDVLGHIQNLEFRREACEATTGQIGMMSKEKANKSKKPKEKSKGKSKGKGKKERKEIVCYNCGGKGHIVRACLSPKKDSNGGGSSGGSSNLGNGGGNASKPKSSNPNQGKGNAGNEAGEDKRPIGAGCLLTAVESALAAKSDGDYTTLFLDSGASGYYIPDRNKVHDYKPFAEPLQIKAAGSDIHAMGSGTMKFLINKGGVEEYRKLKNIYWVPKI